MLPQGQDEVLTPRLSFKEHSGHSTIPAGAPTGLTCTVTTKILTTCSISLKGLRPLARNLSQGLIKKYLRRRRRSSSSRGGGGAGEAPAWVPYPGLVGRRCSVSVGSEESSGDRTQPGLPPQRKADPTSQPRKNSGRSQKI